MKPLSDSLESGCVETRETVEAFDDEFKDSSLPSSSA